ncbi:unnamed protein product [Gadus morhua 'NCC']
MSKGYDVLKKQEPGAQALHPRPCAVLLPDTEPRWVGPQAPGQPWRALLGPSMLWKEVGRIDPGSPWSTRRKRKKKATGLRVHSARD